MNIRTIIRLSTILVVALLSACTKKEQVSHPSTPPHEIAAEKQETPLPDHSQEVIPDKELHGFLDLTWGMPMTECRKRMEARPGVVFKATLPSGGLIFEGGEFAGKSNVGWILQSGGGFHFVALAFIPEPSKAVDEFNAFKAFIAQKYGKPDEEFAFVEDPYQEGDGRQTEAIQNGKGHYTAFWKFVGDDMIQCEITPKLTIAIRYANKKVGEDAQKKRVRKAFDDL